jgi:hypothetical protein
MATNSTPQIAYLSTILPLQGVAGSSNITATLINATAAWEIRIPFQGVQAANVSAGPELWVYEAVAGSSGAAPLWTTLPLVFPIPFRSSGNDTQIIRLDTGLYLISLNSGGPNTSSIGALTAQLITGVLNQ